MRQGNRETKVNKKAFWQLAMEHQRTRCWSYRVKGPSSNMNPIDVNSEHTTCYIYGQRQGTTSLLGLGFLMFSMVAGMEATRKGICDIR